MENQRCINIVIIELFSSKNQIKFKRDFFIPSLSTKPIFSFANSITNIYVVKILVLFIRRPVLTHIQEPEVVIGHKLSP